MLGAAHLLVRGDASVDGGEGLLGEDVVEAGRPLAGAEAGGVRAVVHHEGDAAGVHVRVERVDGLDDGLIADLRVGVALGAQAVDRGHHGRAVHARREGVKGSLLASLAGGAHLLADLRVSHACLVEPSARRTLHRSHHTSRTRCTSRFHTASPQRQAEGDARHGWSCMRPHSGSASGEGGGH